MNNLHRVLPVAWSNATAAGALLLTVGCGQSPVEPLEADLSAETPSAERPATSVDELTTQQHAGAFPGFEIAISISGDDVVLDWSDAALGGTSTIYRSEDPHLLADMSPGAPPPAGVTELAQGITEDTFVDAGAASSSQMTPRYYYRITNEANSGDSLSTMVMKNTVATAPGYNKFGLCMITGFQYASDLEAMFGDALIAVYRWNPVTQDYEGWQPTWGLGFEFNLGNVFVVHLNSDAPAFSSMVGVVPTDEEFSVTGESGFNWATMPAMYEGPDASYWVMEAGYWGVAHWNNDSQTKDWYWGEGYTDIPMHACGTYDFVLSDQACTKTADCDSGKFCHFVEEAACGDTAPGLCLPKPIGCEGDSEPVCGCDDVTYDTKCDAALAGVSVAYDGECAPDTDGDGDPDPSDCAPEDPNIHAGATDECNGIDDDCDGVADQNCEAPAIELSPPTHPPVDTPASQGVCGRFAVLGGTPDPHQIGNLPAYMTALESADAYEGLYSDINFAQFGNGCVSEGDFPGATAIPVAGAGNLGTRMRGYLNIPAPMTWTLAVIGNDAIDVSIGGNSVAQLSWSGLGWKRTVGVSFPEAGLYPLEVQWSSNQACGIDPLEFGHAFSIIDGDNDTVHCGAVQGSCGWSAATDYSFIDSTWYVPSTDGEPIDCTQCDDDGDCDPGQACNDAGLCQ